MCQVCFKYLINHSRYIFYKPSDSDIADIYRIIVDQFSIDKLKLFDLFTETLCQLSIDKFKVIWPVHRDAVSALYRKV